MDIPAYIGKRMRELLAGASISILPFPSASFGKRDERPDQMRRYLFIGHKDRSSIYWSFYILAPRKGIWDYSFKTAAIDQYTLLFERGEVSAEDLKRHSHAVSVACETPTRDNWLLWYFCTEDEDEITAQEARIATTMAIDRGLTSRPDVATFVSEICGRSIDTMKENALNLLGDYGFVWNDFGYYVDYKYFSVGGIERVPQYTAQWAYKRILNTPAGSLWKS